MAARHITPAPEALDLGLRRVRWVRISISGDGVRAEVVGVAHRLPVVRAVPLRRATALIRAGCPYVVRRSSPVGVRR